mgnify:FL=1
MGAGIQRRKQAHILSGILKCPCCGKAVIRAECKPSSGGDNKNPHEQQMDNLDVTDTHYDKKISDLQRRLDAQYDRIDEVKETMAELKSQIYELKKNQIDADSIYGFLGAFNEVYSEY